MGSPITIWKPQTPAEKNAVHAQLDRLLAHPAFKSSKRCPNLLRYVVEYGLQADGEHLKERTLGVKVFGRDPGYDTNLDPIVRATAGEIRKRIAQYYHERGHEGELRIDLPLGSYAPEFHQPLEGSIAEIAPVEQPPAAGVGTSAAKPVRGARLMVVAAIVVTALMAGWWIAARPVPALDQFWNPLLASSGPVLVCIGQPGAVQRSSPGGSLPQVPEDRLSLSDHIRNVDHIVLSDAMALSRLVGLLGRKGKEAVVKGALSSTLTDLRQGATILVAAFDNPWTLRLTNDLRFHFIRSSGRKNYIEDRKDPSRQDWSVDVAEPYSNMTQDYAVVARFRDTTTRQMTVVAAGIGENGTIAAGEFVTTPGFLEELARQLPKGWSEKNVEVLLATQVIDRKSGPPRIVATHVW